MALAFQKYVERRDECLATKFIDISQAAEIANLFNPVAYNVETIPDLRLVIAGRDPFSDMGMDIEINRGDFIVRTTPYTYKVVPRQKFQEKFMEPSK